MVMSILRAGLFLSALSIPGTLLADESPATSPPATSRPDTSSQPTKKSKRGIEKLDNKSRVKALAAITALIILGFGMISLTWLGARVTRRYMSPAPFDHQRKKSSAPAPDDWAGKPLVDHSEFEKDA